jgi:hypothetical protein
MAFQNPIFNGNLYGGLTRFAMNGFAQTQRVATANAAGIKFAQGEAFAKAPTKSVLVSLDSATAIAGAANRWTYAVRIWFPTPIAGGGMTLPTGDKSGTYAAAINLREWHNTSTLVDRMDISLAPIATVGPVGSTYNTGTSSWPTAQLDAKVELHVCYDSSGATFAYFDRPNPIRCTPAV